MEYSLGSISMELDYSYKNQTFTISWRRFFGKEVPPMQKQIYQNARPLFSAIEWLMSAYFDSVGTLFSDVYA